jgi:hypothetical protein
MKKLEKALMQEDQRGTTKKMGRSRRLHFCCLLERLASTAQALKLIENFGRGTRIRTLECRNQNPVP